MTPHTIIVDNVNQALPEALWYLRTSGVPSPSRNGPVIVAPGPVLTVYNKPWQRVLFSPLRDANPFMHFFEALWMLAGRNDVEYVAQFAPRMKSFSDDGITLHGAYGFRWRKQWFDQISTVIEHLKKDPESRREVITMWGADDLVKDSKDKPCNTQVYVDIRNEGLNLTVLNRSNDVILGAYGANVVHMSFLQEFIAAAVEAKVGDYVQFSNNFHLYTDLYNGKAALDAPHLFDFTEDYPRPHFNLVNSPVRYWLLDCEFFVTNGFSSIDGDPFFVLVAEPMLKAWKTYKEGNIPAAVELCFNIAASDWRKACREWLTRRLEKRSGEEVKNLWSI